MANSPLRFRKLNNLNAKVNTRGAMNHVNLQPTEERNRNRIKSEFKQKFDSWKKGALTSVIKELNDSVQQGVQTIKLTIDLLNEPDVDFLFMVALESTSQEGNSLEKGLPGLLVQGLPYQNKVRYVMESSSNPGQFIHLEEMSKAAESVIGYYLDEVDKLYQ